MSENVRKFNDIFGGLLIISITGLFRSATARSVPWRKKVIERNCESTRQPLTNEEVARRTARDARLAALFARFDAAHLANAVPFTPEQQRIIDTPLGCLPK